MHLFGGRGVTGKVRGIDWFRFYINRLIIILTPHSHFFFLQRPGANVSEASLLDGLTPLHCAASCGRSEACMFLLTKGAEMNARDKFGRTPLHLAAESGGTHVVRVLMLCGAKKGIWDDDGKTPFDYAVRSGKKCTVESLLVYQAPKMSSKHSIDFLFHKMIADGEHKDRKSMSNMEKKLDDVSGAVDEARRKGIGMFKWGASMVRKGVRIADSKVSGSNMTEKMAKESAGEEAGVQASAKKSWKKAIAKVSALSAFKSKQSVNLDDEVEGIEDLEAFKGGGGQGLG